MQKSNARIKKFLAFVFISCLTIIWSSPCFANGRKFDPNLRPVKLISQNADYITLDNFRWGSDFDGQKFHCQYGKATIRFSDVAKVYLCSEDFPPKAVAAHISLAFVFRSDKAISSPDGKKNDFGLVISATNRLYEGETPASFQKAFFPAQAKDPWPLVYEIGGITDRIQNSLTISRQTVKMYPLKLSQSQMESVLKTGFKHSLIDRSRDYYHVLTNNCVVAAYRILMQGLGNQLFKDFWALPDKLVSHNVSLPKFSPGYLSKKGLNKGEKITLEAGQRSVKIPTPMGQKTIDLTRLPGYGRAPQPLIPFVIQLENYIRLVDASYGLARLNEILSPAHPDFFNMLKTRQRIADELSDSIETIVQIVKKAPETTLLFYIEGIKQNKLLNDKRYAPLNSALFQTAQFELNHSTVKNKKDLLSALQLFQTFPRD